MANASAEDSSRLAGGILSELYALIAALDRRVPRLERVGEVAIARDAAALRQRAIALIHQIEGEAPMQWGAARSPR
jgi:hypothetical protein